MSPDVGQLATVGEVHRPRSHGGVGRRVHVEPPEEVGAGERGVKLARGVPDLRRLHQRVGLPPEMHLALVAVIPAVAHYPVLAWRLPGQIGGLDGASDGRQDGADAGG